MNSTVRTHAAIIAAIAVFVWLGGAAPAQADREAYTVRNLVSDVNGAAEHTDPHLQNGWGVAFNPTAVVWVASNGKGVSTLYDGDGNPQSLVVAVPGGNPTGIVFNPSSVANPPGFVVSSGGKSGAAAFIFATEAGIISGWSPAVDRNNAIPVVDNSASGAVYKGLALATDGHRFLLYAADFHNKRIDVFDSSFHPVTVPGGFADSSVPSNWAPFNVQNIGGSIYVAYAQREKEGDDEAHGRGLGMVNVFTAQGQLVRRIAKGGPLNAPWGMVIAPSDFGLWSNMLLIGNFGDGVINVYDPGRGRFVGQLQTPDKEPIVIPGLWGLAFGNGLLNQPTNTLFFAAGPDDESHGLYGRIDVAPVP